MARKDQIELQLKINASGVLSEVNKVARATAAGLRAITRASSGGGRTLPSALGKAGAATSRVASLTSEAVYYSSLATQNVADAAKLVDAIAKATRGLISTNPFFDTMQSIRTMYSEANVENQRMWALNLQEAERTYAEIEKLVISYNKVVTEAHAQAEEQKDDIQEQHERIRVAQAIAATKDTDKYTLKDFEATLKLIDNFSSKELAEIRRKIRDEWSKEVDTAFVKTGGTWAIDLKEGIDKSLRYLRESSLEQFVLLKKQDVDKSLEDLRNLYFAADKLKEIMGDLAGGKYTRAAKDAVTFGTTGLFFEGLADLERIMLKQEQLSNLKGLAAGLADGFVTLKDAMVASNVPLNEFAGLLERGVLPVKQFGQEILVNEQALINYVQSLEATRTLLKNEIPLSFRTAKSNISRYTVELKRAMGAADFERMEDYIELLTNEKEVIEQIRENLTRLDFDILPRADQARIEKFLTEIFDFTQRFGTDATPYIEKAREGLLELSVAAKEIGVSASFLEKALFSLEKTGLEIPKIGKALYVDLQTARVAAERFRAEALNVAAQGVKVIYENLDRVASTTADSVQESVRQLQIIDERLEGVDDRMIRGVGAAQGYARSLLTMGTAAKQVFTESELQASSLSQTLAQLQTLNTSLINLQLDFQNQIYNPKTTRRALEQVKHIEQLLQLLKESAREAGKLTPQLDSTFNAMFNGIARTNAQLLDIYELQADKHREQVRNLEADLLTSLDGVLEAYKGGRRRTVFADLIDLLYGGRSSEELAEQLVEPVFDPKYFNDTVARQTQQILSQTEPTLFNFGENLRRLWNSNVGIGLREAVHNSVERVGETIEYDIDALGLKFQKFFQVDALKYMEVHKFETGIQKLLHSIFRVTDQIGEQNVWFLLRRTLYGTAPAVDFLGRALDFLDKRVRSSRTEFTRFQEELQLQAGVIEGMGHSLKQAQNEINEFGKAVGADNDVIVGFSSRLTQLRNALTSLAQAAKSGADVESQLARVAEQVRAYDYEIGILEESIDETDEGQRRFIDTLKDVSSAVTAQSYTIQIAAENVRLEQEKLIKGPGLLAKAIKKLFQLLSLPVRATLLPFTLLGKALETVGLKTKEAAERTNQYGIAASDTEKKVKALEYATSSLGNAVSALGIIFNKVFSIAWFSFIISSLSAITGITLDQINAFSIFKKTMSKLYLSQYGDDAEKLAQSNEVLFKTFELVRGYALRAGESIEDMTAHVQSFILEGIDFKREMPFVIGYSKAFSIEMGALVTALTTMDSTWSSVWRRTLTRANLGEIHAHYKNVNGELVAMTKEETELLELEGRTADVTKQLIDESGKLTIANREQARQVFFDAARQSKEVAAFMTANVKTFQTYIRQFSNFIGHFLIPFANRIQETIIPVFGEVSSALDPYVKALGQLGDRFGKIVADWGQTAFEWVKANTFFGESLAAFVIGFGKLTEGDIQESKRLFQAGFKLLIDGVGQIISEYIAPAVEWGADFVWQYASGALGAAWEAAKVIAGGLWKALQAFIAPGSDPKGMPGLTEMGTDVVDQMLVEGAKDADFSGMATTIYDGIRGAIAKLPNVTLDFIDEVFGAVESRLNAVYQKAEDGAEIVASKMRSLRGEIISALSVSGNVTDLKLALEELVENISEPIGDLIEYFNALIAVMDQQRIIDDLERLIDAAKKHQEAMLKQFDVEIERLQEIADGVSDFIKELDRRVEDIEDAIQAEVEKRLELMGIVIDENMLERLRLQLQLAQDESNDLNDRIQALVDQRESLGIKVMSQEEIRLRENLKLQEQQAEQIQNQIDAIERNITQRELIENEIRRGYLAELEAIEQQRKNAEDRLQLIQDQLEVEQDARTELQKEFDKKNEVDAERLEAEREYLKGLEEERDLRQKQAKLIEAQLTAAERDPVETISKAMTDWANSVLDDEEMQRKIETAVASLQDKATEAFLADASTALNRFFNGILDVIATLTNQVFEIFGLQGRIKLKPAEERTVRTATGGFGVPPLVTERTEVTPAAERFAELVEQQGEILGGVGFVEAMKTVASQIPPLVDGMLSLVEVLNKIASPLARFFGIGGEEETTLEKQKIAAELQIEQATKALEAARAVGDLGALGAAETLLAEAEERLANIREQEKQLRSLPGFGQPAAIGERPTILTEKERLAAIQQEKDMDALLAQLSGWRDFKARQLDPAEIQKAESNIAEINKRLAELREESILQVDTRPASESLTAFGYTVDTSTSQLKSKFDYLAANVSGNDGSAISRLVRDSQTRLNTWNTDTLRVINNTVNDSLTSLNRLSNALGGGFGSTLPGFTQASFATAALPSSPTLIYAPVINVDGEVDRKIVADILTEQRPYLERQILDIMRKERRK